MNIADASFRVGQIIKKIDEGKRLFELLDRAKEVTSEDAWSNFYKLLISGGMQGIKHYYSFPNTYYLLEGNKDNEKLVGVLKNEITEILSINEYKSLCELGIFFGNAIEELIKDMLNPLTPQNFAGNKAKPKLKRSIQDLHVAVQRTEIAKSILQKYVKNQNFMELSSNYDSKRIDYPFSKKNRMLIKQITKDEEQRSLLLFNEALNSILYFMKQIIFETHLDLLTVLSHNDISLKKVKRLNKFKLFIINTTNPEVFNRGNILMINSPTNTEYGIILSRNLTFNHDGFICKLKGYLYTDNDEGIFN
jgi:hypothetical protein